ncbi:MAG: hypothetical protein JNN07_02860 [Verrucomicrobiales bacterium]|nr:hypothetical protein [Verrucomicrobiales bacterium]
MEIPITQITKSFREFYPEAVLRNKVHYAFAHQFLPGYVWQNPFAWFSYLLNEEMPGGKDEPTDFIQRRWSAIFETRYQLVRPHPNPLAEGMTFRRVSDLAMSMEFVGGRHCALVSMPTPEESPQAYFVAVVQTSGGNDPKAWTQGSVAARIFTLELAQDGNPNNAALGEWVREGKHALIGFGVKATREDVLRAIAGVLDRG